jgi:hypothetical protein
MRRILAVATVYVCLFGFLQASPVGDSPKEKSFLRHLFGEGETVAIRRFSGALAGGFVSKASQPARFHTFASGMSSAGILAGNRRLCRK